MMGTAACKSVGRILDLDEVGDAQTVRFLSLEPQRERIDPELLADRVPWLIQGGESGRRAYPFELAWTGEGRDAFATSGTAYFLKQLGRRVRHYPWAARREIPRAGGDKNLVGAAQLGGSKTTP